MTSRDYANGRVILIRQGTRPERALFVVPDEAGSLELASQITAGLDPAITVYGLPATPPKSLLADTLEASALRHAWAIRAEQPHGPYRLLGCGWSGLLAYEIAVQLMGHDECVEFLGVVNCPGSETLTVADLARIRQAAPFADDGSRSVPAEGATKGDATAQTKRFRSRLARYRPQSAAIPVWVFAPENLSSSDQAAGWKEIIPSPLLRVIPIAGREVAFQGETGRAAWARMISRALEESSAGLRAKLDAPHAALVPLQSGRSGTVTLFCIPGAGATVVSFTELIGRLGRNWQIYGLQPKGMEEGAVPHSTIDAAVYSYFKAVDSLPVDGPVHLLGHSYGGWAVFDLACRLAAAGRAVASVTMVDSSVPGDGTPIRNRSHAEALQEWLELFELILGRPTGVSLQELEPLPLDEQLARVHARLVHFGLMPKTTKPGVLRGPFHAFAAALRSDFAPRYSLHGPVRLVTVDDPRFDQSENQRRNADSSAQWRQFAPDLEVFHAPGNHMSVLKEPHVHAMGDWLREAISRSGSVSARLRAQVAFEPGRLPADALAPTLPTAGV